MYVGANRVAIATEITAASISLAQAEDELARARIEHQETLDRPWEQQEVRDAYARALQAAVWNRELAQARYTQALAADTIHQHDLVLQELEVVLAEAE